MKVIFWIFVIGFVTKQIQLLYNMRTVKAFKEYYQETVDKIKEFEERPNIDKLWMPAAIFVAIWQAFVGSFLIYVAYCL